MSPIEQFFDQLLKLNIWIVAKIFILIALLLYLAFTFLVLKEVDLMNRTLKGVFNLPLKIFAWLHFILALFVLILSLIIL